ncbi:dimethylaniline monooxygenase (N-oxide forming) [Teratosphaeria destructans]|uniref:Dimethylaniline monooxygenase (N-oxide forming) n=1 Tax=Teratosphaeria destructans TaxID=418781 RepID=A0A9W7SRS9_9PEZI|nr:dimethylaniline monooxygenase (N-oxide forming) [Teratosphaeria destructans]
MPSSTIRTVAVIGAGASGISAAAASALSAEDHFEKIRVFERRETSGGTWLYDADPGAPLIPIPGQLPPDIDPELQRPRHLPARTEPSTQERYLKTPVYADLTTNVPDIAMSFSDNPFPYGPFVPHWVPKQCIQSYFSHCRTDSCLQLNTTVEDLTKLPGERWALTLRRHDPTINQDLWWREDFDALILANGHYTIPFIPAVPGLPEYLETFPGKVFHSKSYRDPHTFAGKKILVIGSSASGYDIGRDLVKTVQLPLYQSRRSRNRLEPPTPPEGFVWKPVITRYDADSGDIHFQDGSVLGGNQINHVIYCTGYLPSFPFWNNDANGGPFWDYRGNRMLDNYQHTFLTNHPTLGIVGMIQALTFRSFEYQAIALARLFAGRAALPGRVEQQQWYQGRVAQVTRERRKFHALYWDDGETLGWFRWLYDFAGLPQLTGPGKVPPVIDAKTRWAIEHIKKHTDNPNDGIDSEQDGNEDGWFVVRDKTHWDTLFFI